MRPHPRLAQVDPSSPRAWGTCDRCGFVTNLNKLSWQHEWAGLQLINKRILVCTPCHDTPQRQLGSIVLPPDPMPVMNARPENYRIDELWERMVETSIEHGALSRYLEASTVDEADSPMARSYETSTEA